MVTRYPGLGAGSARCIELWCRIAPASSGSIAGCGTSRVLPAGGRSEARIRINQGKGAKDRYVPFPAAFKETLALHIDAQQRPGASHLFESSWKKPYSDRGVRKILTRYATAAGITGRSARTGLRHFLFTWLKTQGIDDALIQLYSGHATRQSLEIYSRLALADAQDAYNQAITSYPV